MKRPGFTIRRVDVPDDVIELAENTEDESELGELRELLDETVGELRKVQKAHSILFEETKTLRDELIEAHVEIQNLKFAAAVELVVEPDDGRKFVSDGRGGEIEVTAPDDLTSDQDPE